MLQSVHIMLANRNDANRLNNEAFCLNEYHINIWRDYGIIRKRHGEMPNTSIGLKHFSLSNCRMSHNAVQVLYLTLRWSEILKTKLYKQNLLVDSSVLIISHCFTSIRFYSRMRQGSCFDSPRVYRVIFIVHIIPDGVDHRANPCEQLEKLTIRANYNF